jgi:hypothetical protein
MIEQKQFAGGGLNQDVDNNFLKPNEWTDALNIRNTDRLEGSDGVISNIKGNTLVAYSPFTPTPPVIINVTYTPSPGPTGGVQVTLSQALTFDKSFNVYWEGLNSNDAFVSGNVSVLVIAGNTSGEKQTISPGPFYSLIHINPPSYARGYTFTYAGDYIDTP